VLEAPLEAAAEHPVLAFALALAIGALIGVERARLKASGDVGAGLRTFVLVAEAGAVAAWLARELESPWVFAAAGALVTALVVAGYLVEARVRPQAAGLTTEIAAVVTYLLGGAVILGAAEIAVALAIATTAVLAFKEPLHGAVARIGHEDLEATLKLLIATFVVLPVLPDRAIDPWGVLNPYAMWWLVILISALSFAGYVATRVLGESRGSVLTGLAGGLVSSTAVTLGFARQSRERAGAEVRPMAAGLLLAWGVMFVRVLVVVAVVHRPLFRVLALPFAAMAATTLALAVRHYLATRGERAERAPAVQLKNPFRLTASIRFALVFALVLLVVELARRTLPAGGLYVVAALAGLTDVDAITLSMAGLARGGTAPELAAGAIVVAALANTCAKCAFVASLGSAALRRSTLRATAWILASGAAALALARLT
jgi:uncharacterized membrane protein (DUF4010 family)